MNYEVLNTTGSWKVETVDYQRLGLLDTRYFNTRQEAEQYALICRMGTYRSIKGAEKKASEPNIPYGV